MPGKNADNFLSIRDILLHQISASLLLPRLEIVKRSDNVRGFVVQPKRWIVERTFGWLTRYRRLSKDYEYLTATSEAMIHVAMINLMVRRLARKPTS